MPPKSKREKITAQTEAHEFDIDKALNTKGFAEFLAAHQDAETFDMDNAVEVGKRFEAFEVKEVVKKELKGIFSEHIQKEMGMKLDSNDLESVGAHIDKLAIENPDELLAQKKSLEDFHALNAQIGELEGILKEAGPVEYIASQLSSFHKDHEQLELAHKNAGFFSDAALMFKSARVLGRYIPQMTPFLGAKLGQGYKDETARMSNEVEAAKTALETVKREHGDLSKKALGELVLDISKRIETTQQVLDAVQVTEKMKQFTEETFKNVRGDLLRDISSIGVVSKVLETKAYEHMRNIMKTGTLQAFDKAQEQFERFQKAADSEAGIDPLGSIDQADKFQQLMDAAMEKRAAGDVMDAVKRASLGMNALTRLERSLGSLMEREKIGSKEGDEAREFIAESLEVAAGKLGKSAVDGAKKLMIARIIAKIRKS